MLKQFVGKLPTNCLSVFDDFVGLTLKGFIFAHLGELFQVLSQATLNAFYKIGKLVLSAKLQKFLCIAE